MANSAWGIDLGNRALKAVKLARVEDRFRIEDFEVIEHEQILSQAGDNKESLLQTALANFVERHDTRGIPVSVSVSGQQSFARFIKLPPVEPKRIPEIIKFEAIQQIPFPLDDVEWSYQLFQDKDSPDVEVGIFAMKKDLVNRHIEYFTKLKLNVQVVQMHPLAVYNAMYYDDRIDQTVMFMDSGAENTDLIIADGQTVWLRSLPIGGNTFTETLAKSFRLSFQKAEELKRNAATSKYAKQIFQAMRPVFADLVAEVQRSIGFYASVHRDARIQRIVAQGATFQLPGLQKYLQQNLQLPVEKLDAFKALPPQDTKVAANLSENLISLAGAYGLALQALGEAKISSSLLPEQIRRAKMWREKTKWFQAAAALFVAGTLGVGARAYIEHAAYDQKAEVRRANKDVVMKAQQYVKNWQSDVEGKGNEDGGKLSNIRSLQDYRGVWPNILNDVLSSLPPNDMAKFKAEKQAGKKRGERQQVLLTTIHPYYRGTEITGPLTAAQSELEQFVMGGDAAGGAGPATVNARTNPGRSAFAGRGGTPLPSFNPEPVPTEAAVPVAQKRGFTLTIRGITPYKDGSTLLQQTLVQSLTTRNLKWALDNKKPYYFARVAVVGFGKRRAAAQAAAGAGGTTTGLGLETDEDPFVGEMPMPSASTVTFTTSSVTPTPSFGARGNTPLPGRGGRYSPPGYGGGRYSPPGYGGNTPLPPRPGATPLPPRPGGAPLPPSGYVPSGAATGTGAPEKQVDPLADRVFTDEKIDQDWEFTVLVVVVMDPAPEEPAAQ